MSDAVLIALIGATGGIISGVIAIVLNRQAAHRAEQASRKSDELAVTKEQMQEWRALVDAKNTELDRVRGELRVERAERRRLETEYVHSPPRSALHPGDEGG